MRCWPPLAILLLIACDAKPGDTGPEQGWPDQDGDGVGSNEDCDDEDPEVFPGADELCNGVDDDCDGFVDDADPSLADGSSWYGDGDGDGWGHDGRLVVSCLAPDGYVAQSGDCDDGSAVVFPGADELCNGVDDDCDGEVDEEGALDAPTWYADADADGHGDPHATLRACVQPSGYVLDGSDCDDGDALVLPGADELCNGVDDDCDGEVDEEGALDPPTWYADADGDGYGDASNATVACSRPGSHVADDSDCDDANGLVFPGADELCNGVDDDCDGEVDETPIDAPTWYADADADAYGDAATTTTACSQPSGYVSDGTDCDDTDATIHPGASELCNGVDDDCDGATDEDPVADAPSWYADADGDGYGDAATTTSACSQPSGYVADDTDCDDADATVHPGASESCDGVDEDCDGTVDEGAADVSTWYADADGDGYGESTTTTTACSQPSGYVADGTDCDDGDAYTNPAASELCDGVDNDCDGAVESSGVATWFDSAGTPTDLSATLGAGTTSTAVTLGITRDGTLNLCAGTWYLELEVGASDVAVVGLAGSGSTELQGDGSSSIVQAITGASAISLEGLTLSGGGGSYGGGIDGGTYALDLTLDDVVVQDCTVSSDGGGIFLSGSTLEATDLVLDNNAATSSGGGLYHYGGSADIAGLTVTDNTAGYISGGAYLAVGSFVLDDALISGNEGEYGAGLMVYYGTAQLTDCQVEGNTADFMGGGAYLHTATVTLDSCQVYDNHAAPGSYSGMGGGLLAYNGSTVVCTGSASATAGIYANSAYYGGGVYLADTTSSLSSSTCDWGTTSGGDDNWYGDVSSTVFWATTYGNDASFTCTGYACY